MALNLTKALQMNVFIKSASSALRQECQISTTATCHRISVGRYKRLEGRSQLLTYEQATKPHEIAHWKSWNSWNTSNLLGGRRTQLTAIEDMFIRRFIYGSWFCSVVGEQIIIKRQHNMIRIAFLISKRMNPQSVYFLTGFSEEMLSIWLHCPVKLEIQAVEPFEGFVKVLDPA
ncbi:28S ribosomal protein S24, mitochondrial [Frankliniella occidentalis]|uniref:28S ribosomal protein S24, mitochondrial n=1 Tax=Frankliniella occidentalis TaxID=133901 RepID=A0A6J1TLK0_FRAOC|nr:28S ribosomal protein S24, mitochondrial [Frankliniella occidentalis]